MVEGGDRLIATSLSGDAMTWAGSGQKTQVMLGSDFKSEILCVSYALIEIRSRRVLESPVWAQSPRISATGKAWWISSCPISTNKCWPKKESAHHASHLTWRWFWKISGWCFFEFHFKKLRPRFTGSSWKTKVCMADPVIGGDGEPHPPFFRWAFCVAQFLCNRSD